MARAVAADGSAGRLAGAAWPAARAALAVWWLDSAAAGNGCVCFAVFHAGSELCSRAKSALYDCFVKCELCCCHWLVS